MNAMNQIQALTERSGSLPDRAQQIAITDSETFARAGVVLRDMKAVRKEIAETFGPIIQSAHATWKEAIAQRKRVEAPLEDAERHVKAKVSAYLQAEEQSRRVETARLAAQAKAEDDERRLEEAGALEAAGEPEAAERVLDKPTFQPPPPPVSRPAPKAAGISSRELWRADVVDLTALVRSVAAGDAPISLLTVDPKVLGGLVRSLKGELKLPGIKVTCDHTISTRMSGS